MPIFLKANLHLEWMGFGKLEGSRVLAAPNVDEAHGLTSQGTIIVRFTAKQKLYNSVSHAVVAKTHYTVSCVYYTDEVQSAACECGLSSSGDSLIADARRAGYALQRRRAAAPPRTSTRATPQRSVYMMYPCTRVSVPTCLN
ncbi:hypothetical protein EVAR_75863_1 [Eumeta japonica]|uniref:Uncharacterized protein n=1 Tax=Eumeta variegata TaxID=151549 RepID=A0A4C1TE86_EUMVA|nr:hypothetical protein EVAR_75863_1 [Eumeta japonica]